ncbi:MULTISPECIES: HD domain-containing protein [unclassified Thioalkalivibrio]|uniref:HD domain-containing protein n=1 Tax=unclassified Thioalkalivibrio TaxID=2621013 RepID=UPI000361F501|nr:MULTISPECIES: HD domain-containing protein [unclassified Thioalkalivibrio]
MHPDLESNLERRARLFATEAHASAGNIRKYTGAPYIEHPKAVAAIVRSVPHTPEMLAAAWLHDTVEDTPTTLACLHSAFGSEVAQMVEMLTDVSRPVDGNRAQRKSLDRDHISRASPEAKTVKLADLLDNSQSILRHDPRFAVIYLQEKRALLGVLHEGDPALYSRALDVVRKNLEGSPPRGPHP